MKKFKTLAMLCQIVLYVGVRLAGQAEPAQQFVHGQWWDGVQFKPATFYSVNGVLTSRKPQGELRIVDLGGAYVLPAFGDAHSHFPDSDKTLGWANSAFLHAGVFYVLNPNDIAELSNPIRGQLGKPDSVDVVFAHAGFTCAGGHPKALYERLVDQKIYSYAKPDLEGRAYYSIDSIEDVAKKWPAFLATKPDFVKLYLVYSEEYRLRRAGRESEGLRPEFIPELVRRAHDAGLRAGAHVDTATDFHNAVAGGVDMIMHLPGSYWPPESSEADYLISDDDARLAQKKHIVVVTTIDIGDTEKDPERRKRVRATQAENLRKLKTAGVVLVLGTDGLPGGTVTEIADLKATGVFSNRELLNMASEVTPAAIFPGRKVGRLRDGYEASFLVLAKNPLEDIAATQKIVMTVKNGQVTRPPAPSQPNGVN